MRDTPKSIVYLRPDTIGDLIIFSSALTELHAAWPDARHTLVVRTGYESLAPLFPDWLQWLVTPLNPFKQKPSEGRADLDRLFGEIAGLTPDLIIAPTLSRTWLETAVAARFHHVRRVVLGKNDVDPIFARSLQLDLGVDVATAFSESVTINEKERDWENQHRLVDYLLQRPSPRPRPIVTVPAASAKRAAEFLAKNALPARGFAAVFPGGLANVQIKAWPVAAFAETVHWLQRDRRLPVLLLGHESEASILEEVAAATVKLGGTRPVLWLGREGELPLLAGLLQASRLYVGHDTGAMHLAAAVGRPVVGIFGGGHWPRFRPVADHVISVVHPLPCFGCNWDCYFSTGPCVKVIASTDVRRAVEKLLAAPENQIVNLVLEASNLPPEALALIATSAPRFRALQSDRLDRQHTIEELKRETDTKDAEIIALEAAATERKTAMEAIKSELEAECAKRDVEIAQLKTETNLKDAEIAAIKGTATDRQTEMGAIKSELEAECALKDAEISKLKAETDTKDAEIEALKKVCDERETLVITLDGHVKEFQRMVAELNAAHDAKDLRLAAIEAKLAESESARTSAETSLSRLPSDYESWGNVLSASQVHIRNLEAMIVLRDRQIAGLEATLTEAKQSVTNYAQGLGGLEQAKFYGKLLGDKEAVIQTLHRACVERAAIIAQLSAEGSGATAGIRKLWIGMRGYFREAWWRPFDTWLFKKVVEDYWMQIGILRHYEPRPLVWDQRIPKARLPDAQLPQIGFVTPSYGQETYIESTMLSVLNQNYPKLRYIVQDGGSKDRSPAIIARYADRLHHWESVRDKGQADAIRIGFKHLEPSLGANDIMAWLNSDDLIAPRALRFVAEYFATHPDVDVIYGHRIIIDPNDRDVGRWIMPPHDPESIEWIDYVPQETLFWRKRAWDAAGGIDPSFQFALDWDLLARFHRANCRIVRLPYFLGCFRVHTEQKTSQAIHTIGAEEMTRIRTRFHGEKQNDGETIARFARSARFRGAITARLLALGLRW